MSATPTETQEEGCKNGTRAVDNSCVKKKNLFMCFPTHCLQMESGLALLHVKIHSKAQGYHEKPTRFPLFSFQTEPQNC